MAANPFDLTGKVAVVTGANAGLGLGFAEGIARAGGDVAIWGRRADRNEQAAAQLRAHGRRVLAQVVDVADEDAVARGMEEVVATLGRIDGVVANAGIQTPQPSFLELSTASWHELLAINLHGAYFTLREGLRHMVARSEAGDPGGSLVVCGSLSITRGVPARQHYAAAKGALAAVTRGIAVEYGTHGVRANVVMPGRIDTGLGGRTTEEWAVREEFMRTHNPVPRSGRPEDVSGAVVYLLSDASTYHTGDLLVIDGGLSIKL